MLGEAGGLGAFHGAELFVLFQDGVLRPEDEAVSSSMLGYWTQHAIDGEPGTVDGVVWPAFEPTTEPMIELGAPLMVREGWPDGVRCDALDAVFDGGL